MFSLCIEKLFVLRASLNELGLNLLVDVLLAILKYLREVLLLLIDYVAKGLILHLGALYENTAKFCHVV